MQQVQAASERSTQLVKLETQKKISALKGAGSEEESTPTVSNCGGAKRGRERARFVQASLNQAALEKQVAEKALTEQYELRLKDRDEEINRLKDFKAKLSTKMVGETLEQHCEIEFNRIRATAFPQAYFEKDNDARSGSKGDYIFKDAGKDGTEIISIMFEMKNESESTASKKKNEDFLKELDKDRREKDCEYANP